MKFTKMHGLGNDFVCIDVTVEHIQYPARLARAILDRRTGVGGDGLILIGRSDSADARMVVFNADGSQPQMCGNGIRCVAKYIFDRGWVSGRARGDTGTTDLMIETDAGVKRATCELHGDSVDRVRVDMGEPVIAPEKIPVDLNGTRIVERDIRIADERYVITCVSMGNPHCIVYVDDVNSVALERVGPDFECASVFPERINTHFVHVESRHRVHAVTWERGSGATSACGTGACAICVAGVLTERTERTLTVVLPGGELDVEWGDDQHVYMTGPAAGVFDGEWEFLSNSSP